MGVTDTFGGRTPQQWEALIAQMIDKSTGQAATRPPDPRHDLIRNYTGTVVSVSDDSVDVLLDTDTGNAIAHCSPGAPASPQQRGNVLVSPSGASVWIGGSPLAAAGGPVQIPQLTPYLPVTAATKTLVNQGTIAGSWGQIPGTPIVFFTIEMLWGINSKVPTFVLPAMPVARRHVFHGYLVQQPGTVRTPIYPYSGFDATTTVISVDVFAGASAPQPLTDLFPGGLTAGASRLDITGTFEAKQ